MGSCIRNPFSASVLVLLSPLAGFLYVGEPVLGLAFLAASVALLMVAGLIATNPYGLLLIIGTVILLLVVMLRQCMTLSRKQEGHPLKWYNRSYIYLFSIVISNFVLGMGEKIGWPPPRAFAILSAAMEPTLEIGDRFLVNVYDRNFGRGDVVVFTHDNSDGLGNEKARYLVKRVVGLPGDRIELRGTILVINDKQYDESYARYVKGGFKDFGPVTVPAGAVFVLGDNRDQSRDSRYWDDPFVPINSLVGKTMYVYWNSALIVNRIRAILH